MKSLIREVMLEFYEDGLPERIVRRAVHVPLRPNIASVVMGMRRTGKTYVTFQLMSSLLEDGIPLSRIVRVNFDDDRLGGMTADDLRLIPEVHAELFPEAAGQMCWYFLDELQNVRGWELFARRLTDSKRVTLCLTGSSSKMLSEDIATQMRGRSSETEVFVLSFAEYLRYTGVFRDLPRLVDAPVTAGRMRNAAVRYFEEGGFPDVVGLPARERIARLQDYVNTVLYRDIIERHDIPSVQALKYTMRYVIHNFARKLSARAISGVLKNLGLPENREAISDYLDYMRAAYLIYPVSLRTDSLSVRRANPEKYYLVDVGLIRAMSEKINEERGWLLENLVFMGLRRNFCTVEYYVTQAGHEVDFHVVEQVTKAKRLVQVAWSMSDEKTFSRERAALLEARAETGILDCVIVTWDDERDVQDGVRVMPYWKWALQENGLPKESK